MIRAGDITAHQGEATTEELLLMHATTFALTRIPSIRFRGAGIFTGTDATPSTTWLGAAGGAFKEGDMFVQTNGGDVTMWQWSVADTDWIQIADFTPPVYHTAGSLGVTTYELATTATMDTADADFSVGDFYRHVTLRRLYGPYDELNGFNFDPVGDGFVYERGPMEHINVGAGRGDPTWNPSLVTNVVENAFYPLDGDSYHQTLTDPIHGGYRWTFDKAAYTADGGDHAAKLVAGWGTKAYARTSRVFNFPAAPADADHLTYITGDYWYDTATRALWGPYNGAATVGVGATADRDAAWGATADQNRLARMHVLTTSADPYIPELDNTTFTNGDTLLVRNVHGGTGIDLPIMFGPYNDDGSPWPTIAVMRGNITFDITQETGVGGTYGAIPAYNNVSTFIVDGLPTVGDEIQVIHVYPDGHATGGTGLVTGLVDSFTITAIDTATGDVTVTANDVHHVTTHANPVAGRLARDNDHYRNGDLLIDSAFAVYGPYDGTQGTDLLAWPLRSPAIASVFHLTNTLGSYQPLADNDLYTTGDVLFWSMDRGDMADTVIVFNYDSTLNTNAGAWTEMSVVRGSYIWEVLQPDGAMPDTALGLDQYWVDHGSPVEGDIIREIHTFPTGHAYGTLGDRTGRIIDRVITQVDRATGDVTSEVTHSHTATRIHSLGTAGRFAFDDNTFTAGDFTLNTEGETYGPYVEGQSTDIAAWPVQASAPTPELTLLSPNNTGFLVSVTDNGHLFTVEQA